MGLFHTSLHIFERTQTEVVHAMESLLKSKFGLSKFERLPLANSNLISLMSEFIYGSEGVYYLIGEAKGNWISIVELNVNIKSPFYLYDTTNGMSSILETYALSFHLHDGDVLYYNLDHSGESADGYTSDPYYFLDQPLSKVETLVQRHAPAAFAPLLPTGASAESLNRILNRGFWEAFDNNDLDEHGLPNNDKYYVDPQDILLETAKYLELFAKDDFPLLSLEELNGLSLSDCYLLRANRKKFSLGALFK